MKKTVTTMADGRTLMYFDESDDATRTAVDTRDLPHLATSSEIRYDVLLDEWVALASHRQSRTHLPPTDQCPLCASTADRRTEIPDTDYDVVVFENRFPSLAQDIPAVPPLIDGDQELFVRQPGIGRCEVVCFTSDHNSGFGELPPHRVRTVLEAWVDRTRELSALPGVEQVFPFENRGEEIGVTLAHPHGQIYAYPFVTPRTRRQLESARRHRESTWRNLFADVLAAEQRAGVRVIASTEYWTAFVPAAARWPVEVHLYPNRQLPDLPALSEEERADFGPLYLEVLRRFDGLFGVRMPYIAAWHQAPTRIDRDLGYLHLELFSIRRAAGKLKYLAGSESGMGAFINDINPEQSAEALRAVPV
jgi:UDPglucose--hexose-1-phosphate uridylyltransferase